MYARHIVMPFAGCTMYGWALRQHIARVTVLP
jgi:hypothetical protein